MFFKNKLVAVLLFLPITNMTFSQEITWNQQLSAKIDGVEMPVVYQGGDELEWPRHTFVDIDNDSDNDLFIGKSNGTISFYENAGDQFSHKWHFITNNYLSINVQNGRAAPTFCDIDADGDFDLFVGDGTASSIGGTVTFYRNVGNSEHARWSLVTAAFAEIDASDNSVPVFCDIDSDGDFDLFVGEGFGTVIFRENVGNSQNARWGSINQIYAGIDVGYKSTPTFTDIDADGDLDLFIGNDRGDVFFYENIGNSNSANWKLVTRNYNNIELSWVNYTAPAFADIDGDNDMDLFISESDFRNVHFYENIGTSQIADWSLETVRFVSDGLTNMIDAGIYSSPAFVDIDADNDFDLFISTGDGFLNSYRNIGNEFEPDWHLVTKYYYDTDINLGRNSSYPTFCDIDNDNDFDLFFGKADGQLAYYQNVGNSENARWVLTTNSYAGIDVGTYGSPVFVDINNDGDLDLFIGTYDGTIWFYSNQGTAESADFRFETPSYFSIDVGISSRPAFADVDNDGDYDLFVGKSTGRLSYFVNNGNATTPNFSSVSSYYYSIDVGTYSRPTLVDINGDNRVDLFVGSKAGGLQHWKQEVTTSIADNPTGKIPNNFRVNQNYPNPFNISTTIEIFLSRSANVELRVHNLSGQLIKTLVANNWPAGTHQISWDGVDSKNKVVSSGIYVYQIYIDGTPLNPKRMILIKKKNFPGRLT